MTGRSCTRERATMSPLGDYLREIRDHDLLDAEPRYRAVLSEDAEEVVA